LKGSVKVLQTLNIMRKDHICYICV